MATAYHFETTAANGRLLTYHECRMWAYRYMMDPANKKSAVRFKRDKERGGWKCCVTFYLRGRTEKEFL